MAGFFSQLETNTNVPAHTAAMERRVMDKEANTWIPGSEGTLLSSHKLPVLMEKLQIGRAP